MTKILMFSALILILAELNKLNILNLKVQMLCLLVETKQA